MIKVYPFASGSEYTASFAISSSFAQNINSLGYVLTASNAATIQSPTSGSPASVNVCLITYDQYLQLINNPGTIFEQCNFG